ncbi:MAG: hypothetical protein IIZ35_03330 [Clostridia bacterium]|nr:hypothetical protein [Clostridia bacterium]
MKKPIATINTDDGLMILYFNGSGEDLTAERAEGIDPYEIIVERHEGTRPKSFDDAARLVATLWPYEPWKTLFFGDDPEPLYVVKKDFVGGWFIDDPAPVSGSEIIRRSREWDCPLAVLIEQVTTSARIVRIDVDGSRDLTLAYAGYDTTNYSIRELVDIANTWAKEDDDGTLYIVEEDTRLK